MNYFKTIVRNVLKHKGYSLINILGLAIGIAVCSLILMWVQDELSYDDYHENLKNIHNVAIRVEGEWWYSSPWALAPLLKQDYPEVEKATRYATRNLLLTHETTRFYETGALVDEDFLQMFTYPFLKGDSRSALSATNSIVITETMANKYFGSEDPLGKFIKINNALDLTVTGVIADVPSNSTFQFEYLVPVKLLGEERLSGWAYECSSYLLLKEGVSVPGLIDKMSGFVMEHDKRTNRKVELSLRPYRDLHLHALTGTEPILYVYLFSAVGVLILLLACVNFMNLTIARAGQRTREIGMRKVVGATKRNLIVQFITESIILSFAALIVAVLLIELSLPVFNDLSGKQLALGVTGNWSHVIGLLTITLITGLVSGSYPAFFLSSFKPITVLKSSAGSGLSKSLFRKVLVIAQFTTTIVLIISTLAVHRQLSFITHKDLGFNRDQVVVIPLNNGLRASLESFKSEAKGHPGIVNVTCATSIPTSVGNVNPVYWEGQTPDDYQSINWVAVDYDYFDTFEMSLVEGRNFSREYGADRQNYVVNEEAAKLMDMRPTVGKMFSIWENEGQIIGVVKNFHSRSLHNGIVPVVFTVDESWDWSLAYVFVKIEPHDVTSTLDYLKTAAVKFAPDFPFDYYFLDEQFNRQYSADRQIATILEYSCYIAIFVACLGLLGITTYTVARRTREIAVRKVLGASTAGVVRLLLKDVLSLIIVANVLGWPIAFMVAKRLLGSYAYQADISYWLFAAAGAVTLLLAFVTVSVQTLKAAHTDAVTCLRNE